MPTKQQTKATHGARGVVGAGRTGQPVAIPVSPPAYVVRQQTGTAFPRSPAAIMEGLGAAVLGAGTTALLVTMLPSDRKWVGAMVAGAFGAIGALTSPIGTWMQEASGGALASSAFYFFLDLTGQVPGQTPTIGQ